MKKVFLVKTYFSLFFDIYFSEGDTSKGLNFVITMVFSQKVGVPMLMLKRVIKCSVQDHSTTI